MELRLIVEWEVSEELDVVLVVLSVPVVSMREVPVREGCIVRRWL